MLNEEQKIYPFSIGIILLSIIVLFSIEGYGRRSRVTGQSCFLNGPKLIKVPVDYPEEAYKLWKKKGFKGRIVVSLSRRLNFVLPEETLIPARMSFPIKVFNLSNVVEGNLKAENFLFVSMETGVVREIIHIMPETVFSEKLEYAGKEKGVSITNERIAIPFFGSPRVIATMPFLKPPDEPVLLYVNASFFRDYEPEELLRNLLRIGLKTDFAVLCKSFDDKDVTDRERERLKTFENLLEASPGK